MTALGARAQELHLRNGVTVSVRPATRDDEASIWECLTDVSIEFRRLRFFSAAIDLQAQAHRAAAGEDADHHGVLAITPAEGS